MANSLSNYLIPLSAVSVVLLFVAQLATAEAETDCYDDKIQQCNKVYQKELNDAGNRNYDAICKAIRKLVECYEDAFQCEAEMAQRWRLVKFWYFSFYNSSCDWSDLYEEIPPEFASGIAFGDPHYAINGKDGVKKVVTCNTLTEILLAQGRRWSVHVNHKPIGAGEGTVVDKVTVRVYPATMGFTLSPTGTPLREVQYTLTSLPEAATADGISVRPDGLTTDWGLEVSAKRRDGYFEVGVSGPDMNNGILVNGNCETAGFEVPTVPTSSQRGFAPMGLSSFFLRRHYRAQANTPLAVPKQCESVDKAFQQACAYDATQLNESWAAESTSSAVSLASEMKKKEKTSQEEANKNFKVHTTGTTMIQGKSHTTGVAATMIQGSAILLMVVMSILMC